MGIIERVKSGWAQSPNPEWLKVGMTIALIAAIIYIIAKVIPEMVRAFREIDRQIKAYERRQKIKQGRKHR